MNSSFQNLWYKVEGNLRSARRSFQTAQTIEDFQAIGIQCRETILSLAEAITEYQTPGEKHPISNQTTDSIFEKLFNEIFKDSSKDQFRAYAKSCLKLANALQHERTATYLQANLCVEATAHLVGLIDAIITTEDSPVNKRFRNHPFAAAEADFILSWIFKHFDTHPVASENGLTLKSLLYKRSEMILTATKNQMELSVKLNKAYWTHEANRVSADRLLDQFIVELLSEQIKREIIDSGQTPV